MDQLKKLRQEFHKFKSAGGHRYPESLKKAAISLMESGVKRVEILKAIKVSSQTLHKWKKEYGSFAKVEVVTPPLQKNIYTIESPNGYLIHGLSKSDLIDLFMGRAD